MARFLGCFRGPQGESSEVDVSELKNQNDSLLARIAALENERQMQNVTIAASSAVSTDAEVGLVAQNAQLLTTISELRSQVQRLRAVDPQGPGMQSRARAATDFGAGSSEVDIVDSELQQHNAQLLGTLGELRAEVHRLQSVSPEGTPTMQAENAELKRQNERLLATVADLRGEIHRMRQVPDSNAADAEGSLQQQNQTLLLNIGELRAKVVSAEAASAEAHQQYRRTLQDLADHKEEVKRLRQGTSGPTEVTELRRQNEQLLLTIGDLRGKLHQLDAVPSLA